MTTKKLKRQSTAKKANPAIIAEVQRMLKVSPESHFLKAVLQAQREGRPTPVWTRDEVYEGR